MIGMQYIILAVIGFAGGIAVAGGVFAFISILEMIPRLTDRLGQACRTYQIENCIFLGGMAGCLVTVFHVSVPGGVVCLALFGLFAGVFIGCLAMALAETLKVIPVLVQRTKLKSGIQWLIAAMAVGKALGCFYQLYFRYGKGL